MKIKNWILVFGLILTSTFGFSQDGKSLFETKCNVCHQINEKSTGPALQGAQARWEKNSSIEKLYKWVKDSKKVLNEGDPYANSLFAEYNKGNMPPQKLSNEEIDAIFNYVENPPVVEKIDAPKGSSDPIEAKPNYELNESFFWALLVIGIVLVIAIAIFGSTLKTLIGSDYYKERVAAIEKEEDEKKKSMDSTGIIKTIAILCIGSLFPIMSKANTLVSTSDVTIRMSNFEIYAFLTIDLVLLGILIYLGGFIKTTLNSIRTQKQIAAFEKRKKEQKTISQVLTDAVNLEEESSILMDHEYDGIQELDNNLPPWWKWGFYVSIVFACFYFTYYTLIGPSQVEVYNEEMEIANIARQEYLKNAAMNVDETNATIFTEAEHLKSGQLLFQKNCAVCHKPDGSGETGPNLTDRYWIYGYDIKEIFKTVSKGTDGGMEAWSKKLNPIQIQEVSSFITTMPEVNGQAPKGDIVEPNEELGSKTDSTITTHDTINK